MKSGMDKLEIPRPAVAYSFLTAAVTYLSPELREARLAWAKHAALTSVVDDFFDVWGSEEELINLVQLIFDREARLP